MLLLLCVRVDVAPEMARGHPWGSRAPRSVLLASANDFAGSLVRRSSPLSVLPNSLCLAAIVASHTSQCSRLCLCALQFGHMGSTVSSSLSWTYSMKHFWCPLLSCARNDWSALVLISCSLILENDLYTAVVLACFFLSTMAWLTEVQALLYDVSR